LGANLHQRSKSKPRHIMPQLLHWGMSSVSASCRRSERKSGSSQLSSSSLSCFWDKTSS
jgi:hypothetical protein